MSLRAAVAWGVARYAAHVTAPLMSASPENVETFLLDLPGPGL